MKLDVDPLPIYRASLEPCGSPSRCASALFGLAETGDEHDRPVFEGT
ncbi:MAG: hypothetical protein HC897_03520 [Thermoanaerobaculia bacterium]|nr:hypothetical protein [Thermoanaerobaculia bacterium]